MDASNSFIGKTLPPSPEEVSAALGPAATLWKQFAHWLADEHGVAVQQWQSISSKYGWSLRLKMKTRTIVHLSPCAGCFLASFVLGERAVAAARQSDLPKRVLKILDAAPRYAEGTALRLLVKEPKDLPSIRRLAEIKLAN
jgi:hypothetical protein